MITTRQDILSRLTSAKPALERDFPLHRLALFGSWAREEASTESDVDVLVEVDPSIGLRFVTLAERLEAVLGRRVDLVSRRAIQLPMWKLIEPELIDV